MEARGRGRRDIEDWGECKEVNIVIAEVGILTLSHSCSLQSSFSHSLEFVAEMRILTEMKIKNRGTKYFP